MAYARMSDLSDVYIFDDMSCDKYAVYFDKRFERGVEYFDTLKDLLDALTEFKKSGIKIEDRVFERIKTQILKDLKFA